jgi:predicted RNA binding protein YcfA (HicA-like mRNA interferase family)
LKKAGFKVAGRKGSHIKLKKKVSDKVFVVIVPDHSELAKGTLKSILRQANIARKDFLKLL